MPQSHLKNQSEISHRLAEARTRASPHWRPRAPVARCRPASAASSGALIVKEAAVFSERHRSKGRAGELAIQPKIGTGPQQECLCPPRGHHFTGKFRTGKARLTSEVAPVVGLIEGWILLLRVFILVAVSALIANAQCYGACATAECHAQQPSSSGSCHQHKTPAAPGVCQHQHASVSGPESGPALAKADAASHPLLAALVVMPAIATELSTATILPFSGSPPRPGIRGGLSILRI